MRGMMSAGGLQGRTALVTGGARGQGRSHALALAEAGADVVICDICEALPTVRYPLATEGELRQTVAEIQALGRRALGVVADVRSSAQMIALVDRTIREMGRIDILVANAGIFTYAPAWELTEEQWDQSIAVNLKGAWLASRHVMPHMIRQRAGRIIFIASTAGLKGLANLSHYSAAKHGVIGLTRALAVELAPYDITVNAICPTAVDTDIIDNEATYRLFGVSDRDGMAKAMDELNLLKRGLLSPREVSAALLFLASDAARSITGLALTVDAGFLTR